MIRIAQALSLQPRISRWRASRIGTQVLRCVALSAVCAGCSGEMEAPAVGGVAPVAPTDGTSGAPGAVAPGVEGAGVIPDVVMGGSPIAAGTVALRRLNVAEYATTIEDWLGIKVDVSDFPPDGTTTAGFDTVAEALPISVLQVTRFKDAATAVVDTLFAEDPGGVRAKWCSYASGDAVSDEACAAQIVADFAEQAWRRPHSSWPGGEGVASYQAALTAAGPFASYPLETRLKQVLRSVLLGPRFLLRVELTDASGGLDVPSVAARLSYMLWNTAPDTTALQANLLDETSLRAEVGRMLFSGATHQPKFERFLERFPDMWLQLNQVTKLNRDATEFPKFTPALQTAMRAETLAFFRNFIAPPNEQAPRLGELLTQNSPVSDPVLAELYGDSPRLGLLTQASVLAVTSVGTRTSAVRRGHWVMDRLLCEPPAPPPPALAEKIKAEAATADQSAVERERLAQHRVDVQCAGCHQTMDVIGLGLENYDAIGEYRTLDAMGRAIDASGVLPGSGQAFANGIELANALAADPRFARCMAQQLLTYGTGRLYSGADSALLDSIETAAGGSEATFESVLTAVVLSPAFRQSGGKI